MHSEKRALHGTEAGYVAEHSAYHHGPLSVSKGSYPEGLGFRVWGLGLGIRRVADSEIGGTLLGSLFSGNPTISGLFLRSFWALNLVPSKGSEVWALGLVWV